MVVLGWFKWQLIFNNGGPHLIALDHLLAFWINNFLSKKYLQPTRNWNIFKLRGVLINSNNVHSRLYAPALPELFLSVCCAPGKCCWCSLLVMKLLHTSSFSLLILWTIGFVQCTSYLILEQELLVYATQTTIKSGAGLFIMYNRIATVPFNFQVMIAEWLGFYLLPISNALYIISHTPFSPLSILTSWILSQVLQPDHAGILLKQVNSTERGSVWSGLH